MTPAWVSRAKWPVSSRCTCAAGRSRWNASAPAAGKKASFLPQMANSLGCDEAKVFLKSRVQRHVGRVIEEQVQLDFGIARCGKQCGVERIGFRRDRLRMRYTVPILLLDALRSQRGPQRLAIPAEGSDQ